MAIYLQTTAFNLIYVYKKKGEDDAVKIGETTIEAYDIADIIEPNNEKVREAAHKRIKEQTTTAGVAYELLWAEVAWFKSQEGKEFSFNDSDVHEVLLYSGYQRKKFPELDATPKEWFLVNVEIAKKAIAAVKNQQEKIDGPVVPKIDKVEIVYREEQNDAIQRTLLHFSSGEKRMLWNAKMRFGKTLCALELINQLNVEKVLILTHRPTVRRGWFEDFHLINFATPFSYGSKNGKKQNCISDPKGRPDEFVAGKDLATLKSELANEGQHFIYFASVQDLRGHEKGTTEWKKNNKLVFSTPWDLIIFDEAHEGTQTGLGQNLINELLKNEPLQLYLSGTPYNILDQFNEDEIYTWDYNMEQDAKNNWERNHPGVPNPYAGLAQLSIYTYSLADVYEQNPDYVKSDDDFFNFSEFFRTWTGDIAKDGTAMPKDAEEGHFVHEADIVKFLNRLISDAPESYYPYSSEHFRNALSHTLWMVPGVNAAARLQCLINQHDLHLKFGFEVVNVAGEEQKFDAAGNDEGKKEKYEKNALEKVLNAIKAHQRTITLSCGRLTTGVSIPDWTGVFMMNGGYNTSAANYMQTIFRGQTPYKNGAIKTHCYAFDFAPDRTLTVISEYLKQQPSSCNRKKVDGKEVVNTENALHFMPVIAMKGGKEMEFNAHSFIATVNQAYTDHVLSHGFKSRYLFKNFNKFTEADHALLADIGKKLGGSSVKTNSDGTIVVSSNNLTDNTKPPKGGKRKPKGKDGDNEPTTQPRKSKEKKDKEAKSRKVLDMIFVRFPLLLFGCVDNVEGMTIDQLLSDNLIDDESWEEFMPKGLSKAIFRQIEHLVEVDVLISSTAAIIKQVKDADEMNIEERILTIAHMLSKFHFPDKETVLTPWRVVNMHMCDTLGGYDFFDETHTKLLEKPELREQENVTASIFCNPDAKILEINSKSGVYPLWIAYSFWAMQRNTISSFEQDWILWKRVVENNLYVVCKTRMAEKITNRVLRGYNTNINTNTVSFENIVNILKDETKKARLVKKIKKESTYGKISKAMIDFDAVVGNPPYQVMDGGTDRGAIPVYNLFVDISKKINPSYLTMIMPARWYAGGRGLDNFRESMMNDTHISKLIDFELSKDIFSTVDIAGGLSVFLWIKNYSGKCEVINSNALSMQTSHRFLNEYPIVIRSNAALPILNKVSSISDKFLNEMVLSINPFGFRTYFRGSENGEIKILTSKGWAYVNYDEIQKGNQYIDCYKIIIGRFVPSNGEMSVKPGEGYRVLTEPKILYPKEINTETYIDTAVFKTEFEAISYSKYLHSKFARYLLRQGVTSVNITKECFAFVPLQDFTESSDIDWSKSVAEIDSQLYAKYGLTDEEIAFIDSMIKPM